MRHKWYFLNEPTPEFSITSAFNPKFTWKLPKGIPSLEFFQVCLKKDFFEISKVPLDYFNFSNEEWESLCSFS